MLTPNTFETWLVQQAFPLMGVVVGLLAILVVLKLSANRRQATLTRTRAGHSEDSFVHHLSGYGFDPRIARTTYRYLQTEQNVHFPILPQDDLEHDLGLDGEAIVESVESLLLANRREILPGLRRDPIATVEDLIRFVQASPRVTEIAA